MLQDQDDLEKLLRAWGRCYGERPESDEERDAPATHALARAMQFAPGKRQVIVRQRTAMHRAGQGRRAYMAVAAGGAAVGIRVVPASFVDPVPCIETRTGRIEERDWPVPPEIAKVERAALDLQKVHDFRGRCLRINYCTRGSHEDKVLRLSNAIGEDVKLKRFRDEVMYARVWMFGRLSA